MSDEQTPGGPSQEQLDVPAVRSPLSQSVIDSQVLLWYATREGKVLPEDKVQTIVDADILLSAGKRDTALESRFWSAFRDLAAAMQPVSVDSIRATYGYPFGGQVGHSKGLGNAVSTKRWYSAGALVVLTLIVFTQIYWYSGTQFRSDLESHREELDRISGALRDMSFKSIEIESKIRQKHAEGSVSFTNIKDADLSMGKAVISPNIVIDIETLKSEHHQIDLDFFNNARRLDRLNLILVGDECLFDRWDLATKILTASARKAASLLTSKKSVEDNTFNNPCSVKLEEKKEQLVQDGLWKQSLYDIYPSNSIDGSNAKSDDLQDAGHKETLAKIKGTLVGQNTAELSLESSKSTLAVLSLYILPLLYGTLGSLAYTLRSLSVEIQNVTFTRGSDVRYSLRWPLGMLAGVTVGLFFDPTKLSGLAAISPLGLAFLAGYGVELVFTGLDKLVSAFAGGGGRGDATKPAAP